MPILVTYTEDRSIGNVANVGTALTSYMNLTVIWSNNCHQQQTICHDRRCGVGATSWDMGRLLPDADTTAGAGDDSADLRGIGADTINSGEFMTTCSKSLEASTSAEFWALFTCDFSTFASRTVSKKILNWVRFLLSTLRFTTFFIRLGIKLFEFHSNLKQCWVWHTMQIRYFKTCSIWMRAIRFCSSFDFSASDSASSSSLLEAMKSSYAIVKRISHERKSTAINYLPWSSHHLGNCELSC